MIWRASPRCSATPGRRLQLPPAEYFPFWQWLCQRNPGGAAKSLVGIDGAGQVIAHKAMVPFPVVCDGQNLTGGLPCQYVVAVPFRATPVYLQMDVRLLAEYPQKGIDFFCGISRARYVRVDESLRFFGFRVVGRLPVYARPYRLVNLRVTIWEAVGVIRRSSRCCTRRSGRCGFACPARRAAWT